MEWAFILLYFRRQFEYRVLGSGARLHGVLASIRFLIRHRLFRSGDYGLIAVIE